MAYIVCVEQTSPIFDILVLHFCNSKTALNYKNQINLWLEIMTKEIYDIAKNDEFVQTKWHQLLPCIWLDKLSIFSTSELIAKFCTQYIRD